MIIMGIIIIVTICLTNWTKKSLLKYQIMIFVDLAFKS